MLNDAPEKKVSFDKNYAEEVYRQYNESKSVDDTLVIEELTKAFAGKRILLIGPGKSIIDANEKINKLVSATDVITIGLNTMRLDNDYLLTTRKEIYDKAVKDGLNTIVCSNVSKGRKR